MKKYKVSEEFILEAHKVACSDWKQKLEKEFPEVFESKIEVGKWYKKRENNGHILICVTDIKKSKAYGFTYFGEWTTDEEYQNWTFRDSPEEWIEATDKEVEEALIAEAKRRGFEVGVRFRDMYHTRNLRNGIFLHNCPRYGICLLDNSKNSGNYIFWDGQWAEIIDDKSDDKSELKERLDELQKELDILKSQL